MNGKAVEVGIVTPCVKLCRRPNWAKKSNKTGPNPFSGHAGYPWNAAGKAFSTPAHIIPNLFYPGSGHLSSTIAQRCGNLCCLNLRIPPNRRSDTEIWRKSFVNTEKIPQKPGISGCKTLENLRISGMISERPLPSHNGHLTIMRSLMTFNCVRFPDFSKNRTKMGQKSRFP